MKGYFKEISLAIIVVSSALYLFQNWRRGDRSGSMRGDGESTKNRCVEEEFSMPDAWLSGILEQGQKTKAIMNWRDCGRDLKRGDIVLYKTSPAHKPVARILAAQPGDRFRLIPVSNGWNVEIEGRLYTEPKSAEPYRFGSTAPPLIRLYEETHAGQLDSTSILIFSTKGPGDQDSGSLGVLSTTDIVGVLDTHSL